jgi:uncharacterized protein YecT (DUF1311 family)
MRRKILTMCAALAAAGMTYRAPQAHADSSLMADPATLLACVAHASASRETLASCKGVLAEPCIDADGGATVGLVLCWSAEGEAWNALMMASLQRLVEIAPQRSESLRAAQDAWAIWRDAECAYQSDEPSGGSGVQVDFARCDAELVANRAIMLIVAERSAAAP